MRLIAERHENDYSYKIYKDKDFEHFTVMFYFKGIKIEYADYHTYEDVDARAYARKTLWEILKIDMKRGA